MPTTTLKWSDGITMLVDTTCAATELREASGLIDQDGWTTGVLEDEEGKRCALGALMATRGKGSDAIPALVAYMLADRGRFNLEPEELTSTEMITGWNDIYAQTPGAVISALNDAATWIEGRPVDA